MQNHTKLIQELRSRLTSVRNEPSPVLARSLLKKTVAECYDLIKKDIDIAECAMIASSAFHELAQIENQMEDRRHYRREAIRICKIGINKSPSPKLVISYADRVVDHFYDQFAREERPLMNSALADAKQKIGKALKDAIDIYDRILLLSQRASLLRCQAIVSDIENRQHRGQEAVRCSELAVKEDPKNPCSHLSLGQSLWLTARSSKNDTEFFSLMNRAERAFIKAQNDFDPLPTLVLARFYRQTYRPALAIKTFQKYERREQNRRRLLSESFLIGEAAMQLWYNDYEKTSTNQALLTAQNLLSEAIDAGCENARLYMALALVEASLGDIASAEIILRKISRNSVSSWLEVIEQAQRAIEHDDTEILIKGFALGVADSSLWNTLGTYSAHFLKDDKMACGLYETGRHLNPKNFVLLTNFSRVLIRLGDEESLYLAKKYLNQAAQYSNRDRSFVWWRDVKSQFDKIIGRNKLPRISSLTSPPIQKLSFKNVQQRFIALGGIADKQKRGRLFELLFRDLLMITFGPEVVYGSHHVAVSGNRQVDAAFKWHGAHYRVEVKWHDRPIGPEKIDIFKTILKTAEVRGLFVSMSGFTEGAIENAHELGKERTILLIDGNEIRNIFEGNSRFDLLLDKKLDTFQHIGKPYG